MKATFTYDGKTYANFNKLRFVQNSYGFDIVFTITDDAGNLVDLTNYDSVSLQLKNIVGTETENIILVVSGTPTTGIVTWPVALGELALASVMDTEITLSSATADKKFNVGLLTVTQEI